jgi:hypothetical protein
VGPSAGKPRISLAKCQNRNLPFLRNETVGLRDRELCIDGTILNTVRKGGTYIQDPNPHPSENKIQGFSQASYALFVTVCRDKYNCQSTHASELPSLALQYFDAVTKSDAALASYILVDLVCMYIERIEYLQ